MNFNDTFEKALAAARDLQQSVGDALSKAGDQLHPLLQDSVKQAQELQATLAKHASESGAIAQQQAQEAMGHLNEFIKTGSEAAKQTAEQARESAAKMAEQSRKVVESATAAMKPPGQGS
jgi:methyl-accepting chemotaxis protein